MESEDNLEKEGSWYRDALQRSALLKDLRLLTVCRSGEAKQIFGSEELRRAYLKKLLNRMLHEYSLSDPMASESVQLLSQTFAKYDIEFGIMHDVQTTKGSDGGRDVQLIDQSSIAEATETQPKEAKAELASPGGLRFVCRLLPVRLQTEDFGDVLETLAAMNGIPAWRRGLRVGCCALWLLKNAIHESCVRLLQEGMARLFRKEGSR